MFTPRSEFAAQLLRGMLDAEMCRIVMSGFAKFIFSANESSCVHKKYLRAHKSRLTPQTAHLTSYTLTTQPHLTSLCSPRTSYWNSIRPGHLAPHTSNIAMKRINHSIMVLCTIAICMLVCFVFSMDAQSTGSMHSI